MIDLDFGVYDSIFHIHQRFDNTQPKYFLDLNDDTKRALMLFSALDIKINGFAVSDAKKDIVGIDYLGYPVVHIDNIKDDDFMLVKIFPEVGEVPNHTEILFTTDIQEVILYGAGVCGCSFIDFSQKVSLPIMAIYDKKADRSQYTIVGHTVLSPSEMNKLDLEKFIVLALRNPKQLAKVSQYLKDFGFKNICSFNQDLFHIDMYEGGRRTFIPEVIRYISKIALKRKNVYFYSANIPYLCRTVHRLRYFGIYAGAVSDNLGNVPYEGQPRDVDVQDAYDLLYEEDDFYVWALAGEDAAAYNYMRNSGLPEDRFVYSEYCPMRLSRRYLLDAHIGYIDERKFARVRNCVHDDEAIRICVLGGSTSDYDNMTEKSWPYYLLETAQQKGVNLECIVAATVSNISFQELLKLVRDIIWEKPDIVISYSGINDVFCSVPGYRYAHGYQSRLFHSILKNANMSRLCRLENGFYMGRETLDPGKVWIMNERMMHAMCQELGISFYAILQPYLWEKGELSLLDREVWEHQSDFDEENLKLLKELYAQARAELGKKSWFTDLSRFFDADVEEIYFDKCHVIEEKNKVIAQRIYELIDIERG